MVVAPDRGAHGGRRPAGAQSPVPRSSGVRRPVRRRSTVKPPVDGRAGASAAGSSSRASSAQRGETESAEQGARGFQTGARGAHANVESALSPQRARALAAESGAAESVGSVDSSSVEEWRVVLGRPGVVLALRIAFAVLSVAAPIVLVLGLFEILPTPWSVLVVAGAVASWYGLRAGAQHGSPDAVADDVISSGGVESQGSVDAGTVMSEEGATQTVKPDAPTKTSGRETSKRRRRVFVDHGVAIAAPSVPESKPTSASLQESEVSPKAESVDDKPAGVEPADDGGVASSQSAVVADDESGPVADSAEHEVFESDAESESSLAAGAFLPDGDLVPVAGVGVNASKVSSGQSVVPGRSSRRGGVSKEWRPSPLPRPLYQLRDPMSEEDDVVESELPAPRPAMTGSVDVVDVRSESGVSHGSAGSSQGSSAEPSSSDSPFRGGASRYDGPNATRVSESSIAVSAPLVADVDDEELTEHTAAVRRRGRTERRVSLDLDSVLQQRRRASGE